MGFEDGGEEHGRASLPLSPGEGTQRLLAPLPPPLSDGECRGLASNAPNSSASCNPCGTEGAMAGGGKSSQCACVDAAWGGGGGLSRLRNCSGHRHVRWNRGQRRNAVRPGEGGVMGADRPGAPAAAEGERVAEGCGEGEGREGPRRQSHTDTRTAVGQERRTLFGGGVRASPFLVGAGVVKVNEGAANRRNVMLPKRQQNGGNEVAWVSHRQPSPQPQGRGGGLPSQGHTRDGMARSCPCCDPCRTTHTVKKERGAQSHP